VNLFGVGDDVVDVDWGGNRPVRRGVSKGVEDGHRPLALRVGHPQNGRKGVEGPGMAGPGETLGIPCIPLTIRA
jgi:hypothetical protein